MFMCDFFKFLLVEIENMTSENKELKNCKEFDKIFVG